MEISKLDFNSLPEAIETLIFRVGEIRELLLRRDGEKEKLPEFLNFEKALWYIRAKGIPISESKLYKITSSQNSGLPFHKFGQRLIFYASELDDWCNARISNQDENKNSLSHLISESIINKKITKKNGNRK